MLPPLALIHESRVIPLAGRAVQIGRLPECDILLDGAEVSRRHARIVPTPEGPLVVDRSRYGTLVNGAQLIAPQLLHEGDVLQIGPWVLEVTRPATGGADHPETAPASQWQLRLAAWRRRYGWSELTGTVAAVAAAVLTRRSSGSLVLAAYAGTAAEMLWFYGVLGVRDLRRESRAAAHGTQPASRHRARDVLGNLLSEFRLAEGVDALLLRPLCLGAGLRLLGGAPGALAGKLVADACFYGPVLRLFHWRLTRRVPVERGPDAEHRRRATTAAALPLLRPKDGEPR